MNKHNQGASWVRALNCARNQPTTIDTIQTLAKDTSCIMILLQEPWLPPHRTPLSHPDFDTFTPSDKDSKCVTYVRRSALLQPTITFRHSSSYLGVSIKPT
jgi:hypothetical protein